MSGINNWNFQDQMFGLESDGWSGKVCGLAGME